MLEPPEGGFVLALGLQYSLFVFLAAIGTIQLAAAYAGLQGLQLVGSRRWAACIGLATLIGAFAWFFGLVDRNVRGLEGAEQTLLFVPAAVAAIAITGVAASLVHRFGDSEEAASGSMPRERRSSAPRGLEALRSMSYLDALFDDDEGPS
jgi:hypothetical protein